MNSNHPIYLGVMSGTSLDGVDVVAFTPHNNALIAAHSIDFSTYPFYLGHADELGASAGLGFNLNMPLSEGTVAPMRFGAL
jgi:acetoin utilization deacetylase AcuC-like enzyme